LRPLPTKPCSGLDTVWRRCITIASVVALFVQFMELQPASTIKLQSEEHIVYSEEHPAYLVCKELHFHWNFQENKTKTLCSPDTFSTFISLLQVTTNNFQALTTSILRCMWPACRMVLRPVVSIPRPLHSWPPNDRGFYSSWPGQGERLDNGGQNGQRLQWKFFRVFLKSGHSHSVCFWRNIE
jgi:hypothetical protein